MVLRPVRCGGCSCLHSTCCGYAVTGMVKKNVKSPFPADANVRAVNSVARRRWSYYAVTYNKFAKVTGGPRIRTLRDVAATNPDSSSFLTDDEVTQMKLRYYEDLIDRMEPVAAAGFKWLNSQKRRAKVPRAGGIRDLIFIVVTSPIYSDYTNKMLWDELISMSPFNGLTIYEPEPHVIEWDARSDDAQAERSGVLKFRSFESIVSKIRRSSGLLKRPRRRK